MLGKLAGSFSRCVVQRDPLLDLPPMGGSEVDSDVDLLLGQTELLGGIADLRVAATGRMPYGRDNLRDIRA